MRHFRLLIIAIAAGNATSCVSYPRTFLAAPPDRVRHAIVTQVDALRVMSFNLRTPTVIDFHNGWNHRKKLVAQTIKRFNPDLLGTQECRRSQARYLAGELSDYRFVGVGRVDGKKRGEMCGLFFRADRFQMQDEGHFWLSKTPDVPGSNSWDASYRRMVTWVKLRPRGRHGQPFYFFNTHFDNNGVRSRIESAWLLRRRIQSITGGSPAVVTGDFNAGEGSPAYELLVEGPSHWSGQLVDTYRQAHPARSPYEGTRHSFHGHGSGPRIDWIIATANFQTLATAIDRTHDGGRYPSDHFPVTAVLRISQPSLAARPVRAGAR